jgi:1-acyl-sn-glycerol-3-phosphate acyltransferase
MTSPARALARSLLIVLWTLLLLPAQVIVVAIGSPLARRIPMLYHRGVCRILGLRIKIQGAISQTHPTLFVCNHSSYLDITVLGSLLEASFISRHDVAGWPVIGWLAKLQRCVFVERRLSFTGAQVNEIQRRIAAGDSLIFFPEGTSNDGIHLRPFKSALFAVAEEKQLDGPLVVQPLSLAYSRIDGMVMGRWLRPYVAWYGNMTMGPHLWTMMGLGALTAEVEFHAPVTIESFEGRKALTAYCQHEVAAGISAILSGRRPDPPAEASSA